MKRTLIDIIDYMIEDCEDIDNAVMRVKNINGIY